MASIQFFPNFTQSIDRLAKRSRPAIRHRSLTDTANAYSKAATSRPSISMLFFSPIFIFAFLPIVWTGFILISSKGSSRASIAWLLLCSWVFYAWAYPSHLLWLLGSISANYLCSAAIVRSNTLKSARRLLIGGIIANLLLLGIFKYSGFAVGSLVSLFGLNLRPPSFLLPLAISFFTFQQISYLVTTFRSRQLMAKPHEYALYVSFFPQLIAGPIVQPGEMIPQLQSPMFGKVRIDDIALGIVLFIIGLGKKILLADNLAPIADAAFGESSQGPISGLTAWTGLLAFSLQIYFDFSAYSEMALGLGRMFGIRLPENFASPYRATSVIDFWRRWHITLSSFFKNFLYIPLGGNRKGWSRTYINLLIVMTIAGLWHGANWTFLLWGAAHGILLAINHLWKRSKLRAPPEIAWLATFLAVTLCWTLFRSQSLAEALAYFSSLSGKNGWISVDGGSAIAFFKSLEPTEIWKPVHYAFHFLDWYPGLIGGIHPGHLLFSELGLSIALIALAGIIVTLFPRPLYWLTTPANGRPVFSKKAAILISMIVALIIIQSGSFQSSPFIYFRF